MLNIQVEREGILLPTSQELQTGILAQGRMLNAYISTTSSLTTLHSIQLSTVFAYQQIINKGNMQKFVSPREEINDIPLFHSVGKGKSSVLAMENINLAAMPTAYFTAE